MCSPQAMENVAAAMTRRGALDTHGIDPGHDSTFPVHIETFSAGKHGLENIAQLGAVHPSRMTIIIGAPKHRGGSGGPARLFAVA
jgi:kynurenine formamidase